MTPVTCLCNDESSDSATCDNSCPSISVDDANDFIQQLLCYKCKVVDLVKEQMEKSECQQNSLLSQICESKLEKDGKRKKRGTSTATETQTTWLSKFKNFAKKLLYGLLFIILSILAIWLTYTRILGTRVCDKAGLCIPVPFTICSPRPRIF